MNVITTQTVRKSFPSYNQRRYSKPWGALVTLKNGKPEYDFSAGYFCGNHNNGDGGDVMLSNIQTGAIVAFGQKDNRNPKYTGNIWYFVTETGELAEISREEAFEILQNPATPEIDLTPSTPEELAAMAVEIGQRILSGYADIAGEAVLLASIAQSLSILATDKA